MNEWIAKIVQAVRGEEGSNTGKVNSPSRVYGLICEVNLTSMSSFISPTASHVLSCVMYHMQGSGWSTLCPDCRMLLEKYH